ncbi:hypothetical protein ABT136_15430 [Streptomyces sp. NPDC001856]|uniref:hypothetical protein n=1 Tax=Streptomyces sp. NPDC001856 TaxID=3154399 RepID=UPI003323788B
MKIANVAGGLVLDSGGDVASSPGGNRCRIVNHGTGTAVAGSGSTTAGSSRMPQVRRPRAVGHRRSHAPAFRGGDLVRSTRE